VGEVRLATLFPWLEPSIFQFESAGQALLGAGDVDASTHDGDRILSLRSAVHIPGALHILHNMTKDMLDALQHSGVWISQLSTVCKFLSRSWSKRKLLFNCFREGNASAFGRDVAQFHADVHTGRWGSIAFAVGKLLSIREALAVGA
jgi:hypothetical protein